MILGTIAAKWEQIDKEPHGLAVSPFILTTAAPTLADVSWDPEDARGAVRDFLSDPRDSNITGLENFLKLTGGTGQPGTPASRQKVAWPARAHQEVFDQTEEDAGKTVYLPLFTSGCNDDGSAASRFDME